MGTSVAAVVVTYNRRELLERCLAAIDGQTRVPDAVIVFDNASTDDTEAFLREWAAAHPGGVVVRSAENVGGAGGFHQGMRRGYEDGHDWVWVMDDDTITDPDALEQLLAAHEEYPDGERPLLLASVARWRDGCPHPMNWPLIRFRYGEERRDLMPHLAHGHLPLASGTYVSCLFHRETLRRCGLPIADYFIWSDDFEHTIRICKVFRGVLVPRSRALHDTAVCHTWQDAAPARFYYHVRNGIWTARFCPGLSPGERRTHRFFHHASVVRYLLGHWWRPAAWWSVFRGFCHGWLRRPREIVASLED